MKKFCSTCGNQLELSQRLCTQCGTVNPFFSSAFKLLSDQSDALEKLKSEKERIEKELLEKEQEQAEFRRQELLKRSKEDEEKGKEESTIKNELLRVKEETEKYKKETYDLVKEVREEIQQIEADNRRLKQEIENIAKSTLQNTTRIETEAQLSSNKSSNGRNSWFLLLTIIFLASAAGVVYLLYNRTTETTKTELTQALSTVTDTIARPAETISTPIDTTIVTDSTKTSIDSIAVTNQTNASTPTSVVPTPSASKKIVPATETGTFYPTASKIKSDLIGKKISGCDITIRSSSEMGSISQITFIEKLPSGYLKYKCALRITQDEETYNATPYIYYTLGGTFIKVDGTNCE